MQQQQLTGQFFQVFRFIAAFGDFTNAVGHNSKLSKGDKIVSQRVNKTYFTNAIRTQYAGDKGNRYKWKKNLAKRLNEYIY